jgi:hypothetical protein
MEAIYKLKAEELTMDMLKSLKAAFKGKQIEIFVRAVETDETEEIRDFTAQTGSLEFWNDERENLYQDYLKDDA